MWSAIKLIKSFRENYKTMRVGSTLDNYAVPHDFE
jgi:hypothetical protein